MGQETHPEGQGGSRAEDVDPVGRGQAHCPQVGRVRLWDLVRPLRLGLRGAGPLDCGFQLSLGPGHLQQASSTFHRQWREIPLSLMILGVRGVISPHYVRDWLRPAERSLRLEAFDGAQGREAEQTLTEQMAEMSGISREACTRSCVRMAEAPAFWSAPAGEPELRAGIAASRSRLTVSRMESRWATCHGESHTCSRACADQSSSACNSLSQIEFSVLGTGVCK